MASASPAAQALGYGSGSASSLYTGSSVADQVLGESEEERKKRLAALAAQQQGQRPGSVGQGYSAAFAALGGMS
jgi:hypothetical protein